MDEFEWVKWIKKKAGPVPKGWIGIGDDAALFSSSQKSDWLISTDAIVEGVDFDHRLTPAQIGRKALAINLSDMAAMGASPSAFLMTIGVSAAWRQTSKLKNFFNGVFRLARKHSLVCLGGDFSSAKHFFCSITILGRPVGKKAVMRNGARPGDALVVTGRFGGSIRGHHFAFTPRVKEATWLARQGHVSAMLDVSDGLAQDIMHLLRASKCKARINLETIPVAASAQSLKTALSDGEDFELVFTLPKHQVSQLMVGWKKNFPKVNLTMIGEVQAGKAKINFFKHGLLQKNFLLHKGFRHF